MAPSFVPYIEAAFSEPLAQYGFNAIKKDWVGEPYYYDLVRYENEGRAVQVSYEHTRDAYCDVTIEGYGGFEPVRSVIVFARGPSGEEPSFVWTHEASEFSADARRCSDLLLHYCDDFLRGDLPAFRRKYRELFLVAAVRNARYIAAASHEWGDYDRYQEWLADYMTDEDHARAKFDVEVRRNSG